MPSAPKDCRALVVDDNRDHAESLTRLLEAMACAATFTTDPAEAIPAVEAFSPGIVFLDIGMPKIDGFELARLLREKYGRENIRLVALTGYNLPEHRARSRAAGFDAHLGKPASPEPLTQLFQRMHRR
jgi:CheY-like chemotaxis protein